MALGRLLTTIWAIAFIAAQLCTNAFGDAEASKARTLALGSKTLTMVRTDGGDKVSVDGRIVVEHGDFTRPLRRYSDAEVDAVVLILDSGGSGCYAQFVIVWVTKQGNVGKTEPFFDRCYEPDIVLLPGQIIVRFLPSIRRDGTIYRWTLKGGLEAPVAEPFTPHLGKNWSDAETLAGEDPWTAFENASVYEASRAVLGADFERFRTCFDSASPMKKIRQGMIAGAANGGYGCEAVVFAIDPKHERVYVAMRLEDRLWRFYSAESDWPKKLQSGLVEEYQHAPYGFVLKE